MTWPDAIDDAAERAARSQWDAMCRYRLQCVEQWPESDYKVAVLAAIRSSMDRFSAWPRVSHQSARAFEPVSAPRRMAA